MLGCACGSTGSSHKQGGTWWLRWLQGLSSLLQLSWAWIKECASRFSPLACLVKQVGDKAQEAAAITKSTTAAAADVTKQAINDAARTAGRALETKEARRR